MSNIFRTFLLLLLSTSAFSQVRILEINKKFVLVNETSGKYYTQEYYDNATRSEADAECIILRKNGKVGCFSGEKLVLPCIYEAVSEISCAGNFIGLAVRKNGKYAFSTTWGDVQTDFIYSGIQSLYRDSGPDAIGFENLVLLINNDKYNVGYYDQQPDKPLFRLALPEFVDFIANRYQTIILTKGNTQTIMDRSDLYSIPLRYKHPFEACQIEVTADHYYRIFPGKKIEEYEFDYRTKRTLPYSKAKVNEIMNVVDQSYDNIASEDTWDTPPGTETQTLKKQIASGSWKKLNMAGYYGSLPQRYSPVFCWSSIEEVVKDTLLNGKPACKIADTFLTGYDEFFYDKSRKKTQIIGVRKGKKFGIIDTKGNVVLNPEWKKVSFVRYSPIGQPFIAESKNVSYLFFYYPKTRSVDTLMQGLPGDEFFVDGTRILLKRYADKKLIHSEYRAIYQQEEYSACKHGPGKTDIPFSNDSVHPNELLPYFQEVYSKGKTGIYNYKAEEIIPVKYDSIYLGICYSMTVDISSPNRYKSLKPYMICSSDSIAEVYSYNGYKPEFTKSKPVKLQNGKLLMSDDGMFMTHLMENHKVQYYTPDGMLISGKTFRDTNIPVLARYDKRLWYLETIDENGKPVAICENGALFYLPE